MTDRKITEIQNEQLWEFPMDYPLKVLGEARFPLSQIVGDILAKHVPNFDRSALSEKPSSAGKYVSVACVVHVTNKEQINGMYADFAAASEIKLVL